MKAAATFLLIGASLVVLVAWSCAILSETPVLRTTSDDPQWPAPVDEDWPETPRRVFRGASVGHDVRGAQRNRVHRSSESPPQYRLTTKRRIEVHDFGWPWPSLRLVRVSTLEGTTDRYALPLPALFDPLGNRDRGSLPLRPRLPGFAYGTLLFACASWLLIRGPSRAHRGLRLWRGQCVSCGYDLRGSPSERCPECGVS